MTIQFLKYIVAAAEIGSITEAAKQIHISQPSLSAALKEAGGRRRPIPLPRAEKQRSAGQIPAFFCV